MKDKISLSTILILFFLILPGICLLVSCRENNSVEKIDYNKSIDNLDSLVTKKEWDNFLFEEKVVGSILFYDPNQNIYYSNDFERCSKTFLPASTFKIANTIIGLETGVIESDTTLFRWNGEKRRLSIWEKDMNLKEAFQTSCVPCYQEVAKEIGPERMNAFLGGFNYGSMVVDSSNISIFWLEGNSGISQFEQVGFLNKIRTGKLDIADRTYNILQDVMLIDSTDSYVLRGKTGWVASDHSNIGWFVGYVESPDQTFVFATNVEPAAGFDLDNFPAVRARITKKALDTFFD